MKKLIFFSSAITLSTVLLLAGGYKSSGGAAKSLSTNQRISSVLAYNSAGSDRFLLLFDSLSLPANGTAALMAIRCPTQTTGSLDFAGTLKGTNGLTAAISTTDTTLTLTSGNDALILFVYP